MKAETLKNSGFQTVDHDPTEGVISITRVQISINKGVRINHPNASVYHTPPVCSAQADMQDGFSHSWLGMGLGNVSSLSRMRWTDRKARGKKNQWPRDRVGHSPSHRRLSGASSYPGSQLHL